MKKIAVALSVILGSLLLVMPVGSNATTLTPDGGWYVTDADYSGEGNYFDDSPFTFTLTGYGVVKITDIYVTGDSFSVFNGSDFLFSTPSVASGTSFTSNPDVAYASAAFSSGSALLGAGTYNLNVRIDNIPTGYYDSEMAIRVDNTSAVPEPMTLLLVGTGLAGAGLLGRRMKRTAEQA